MFDTLTAEIDRITGLIEFREDKLDGLYSRKSSARIQRRIDRQERRLTKLEDKLDELTGLQNGTPTDRPTFYPTDQFFVTMSEDVNGTGLAGYIVNVVDSIFDPTFTAGDKLYMRTSFMNQKTSQGTRSHHSTFTLANGDYWPEGKSRTTLISANSGNQYKFDNYPDATITIGTYEDSWVGQPLDNIVYQQSFDMTTYF